MMKQRFYTGCVTGMLVCSFANTNLMAATCRVDDDCTCSSGCDGSDWTTKCYKYLQDALGDSSCTDIWVAAGTYFPDDCTGTCDQTATATFDVGGGDGPQLYGGFAGTETSTSQRTFKCYDGSSYGSTCASHDDCAEDEVCHANNETILSGDLDGDDGDGCTIDINCSSGYCVGGTCVQGTNSYHVVSCHHLSGSTPRVDAFIIERGKADGNGPSLGALDNQGSAIQIRSSIKYCQNDSTDAWDSSLGYCTDDDCDPLGSGWSCNLFPCMDGGLNVYNCTIRYNYASDHASVNDHFADSVFDNCYFHHNEAAKGAALLVDNGRPTINDCLFQDNETNGGLNQGGAVWLQGRNVPTLCPANPAPVISDCVFEDNTASRGGGLWIDSTDPTLTDCAFISNTATIEGGGIWSLDSDLTIDGCSLESNQSASSGGGAWILSRSGSGGNDVVIRDSLFEGNSILAQPSFYANGGALYVAFLNDFDVQRCRFIGNFVDGFGAGAVLDALSTSRYVSCLFEGNHSTFVSGDVTKTGALFVVGSTVDLINSSVVSNSAEDSLGQGGLYVQDSGGTDGVINVTNCLLWGNTRGNDSPTEAMQLAKNSNAELNVTYTTIDGLITSGDYDDGTNTDDDPLFVSDPEDCDANGWFDPPCGGSGACPAGSPDNCDDYGDLELTGSSPALEGGDNDAIAGYPFDLNEECRIKTNSGTVDRGAYERGTDPSCCLAAVQCCRDSNCNSGEVCCANTCVTGTCCDDGDCSEPDETCCLDDHTCYDSDPSNSCCTDADCSGFTGCCGHGTPYICGFCSK